MFLISTICKSLCKYKRCTCGVYAQLTDKCRILILSGINTTSISYAYTSETKQMYIENLTTKKNFNYKPYSIKNSVENLYNFNRLWAKKLKILEYLNVYLQK